VSLPYFRSFQDICDDDEKDAVHRASPCVLQAFDSPAWSIGKMHLSHVQWIVSSTRSFCILLSVLGRLYSSIHLPSYPSYSSHPSCTILSCPSQSGKTCVLLILPSRMRIQRTRTFSQAMRRSQSSTRTLENHPSLADIYPNCPQSRMQEFCTCRTTHAIAEHLPSPCFHLSSRIEFDLQQSRKSHCIPQASLMA